MKKLATAVFVLLLALLLSLPVDTSQPGYDGIFSSPTRSTKGEFSTSSISDTGDARNGTTFMSRTITDLNTSILNTYADPDSHNGSIDLTPYHINDWTLYNVTTELYNLTAIPEREVIGINDESYEFRIYEVSGLTNVTQLAQGFYSMSHGGKLQNYSLYYKTPIYDKAVYGIAYFVIRSDYSSSSSNITNPVEVDNVGSTSTWKAIESTANLTSGSTYYAIIDGDNLEKDEDKFPEIQWRSESSSGTFDTYRYSREFSSWASQSYESLLNYTYTPWNHTSHRPLIFTSSDVVLRMNSTSVEGDVHMLTDIDNPKRITLDSNQSVCMNYNMTLWYKRDIAFESVWNVENSGETVQWNLTSDITYPEVYSIVGKFVNISKISDWSPVGLYNGTSNTDHENFIVFPKVVICSSMTNGTWTMTFEAPNYVDTINTYDSADNSNLPREASILADMDINTTIADSGGNTADTGSTNLTVIHEGEKAWAPNNESVVNGKTHYLWNINETTQDNGTYTLEVYWTNGTEAGYLTKEIVVFYPTFLEADRYSIDAYTESSFSVRVQFNDTYNDVGLNGTTSTVEYSYDGEANVSMNDQGNGTWTADIDTSGDSPGTHTVEVFGEGFAIENQSLTISVELIHDTEPLTVQWSDGDSITYVEQTTLLVNYSLFNGTPVTDATVNVTIDSTTWNLSYNEVSELYELRFDGSDNPPGIGTHSLDIKAGRLGYEQQTNSTESLTITIESTTLEIFWSNGYDITYLETTRLSANYTMSNGSAVVGAEVNITAGGLEIPLTWNSSTSMYDVILNGNDDPPGLGTHDVTISAWKFGYDAKTNTSYDLILREEPTFLELEWYNTNTITYTHNTTLRANYTISNGSAIQNAWINVTIGSDTLNMTWNSTSGFYELVFNGTDEETGLGNFSLTVQASKPNYESRSDAPSNLIINPEPTDIQVSWNPINVTIDTTQFLNLSVEYTYAGIDVPSDAKVNVTIDGKFYDLVWNGSHWVTDIPGEDFPADLYDATISAWLYGYESKSNVTQDINITLAANAFQVFWDPADQNITYVQSISVNVTYNHNYAPIENATVRLYLNESLFCEIPFNETYQKYRIIIPARDITLGTWNATIVANKTGYETKQDQSYLTVNEDVPSVSPSWISNTTDFITPKDLFVEFYASNGTPITDGTVEVTVDSETYLGQHVSQGNYSVTIGPQLETENNSMSLYVYRYGYRVQTIDLYLEVVKANSTMDVSHTDLDVYYDDTVNLAIEYSMDNESSIYPANLTFHVDGENHTAYWNGTLWEATLNATQLDIGTHSCVVNISAYGFISREQAFQVVVSAIPTSLEIDGSNWMYVNDSISFTVEYLDDRTSTRIEAIGPSISWTGSFSMVKNGNLTYSLTIHSTNVHSGDYSLSLSFSRTGYEPASETPTIEVRRLPLSLIFDAEMSIYENESMRVSVLVNDTYHRALVDFAQVNLTLEGAICPLEYDNNTNSYSGSIWLNSTITPNNYTVTITASAIDCQTAEEEMLLQVLAKADYALTAEVVGQTSVVTEGSALALRAILEDSNGNPLPGKTIVFFVRMVASDGETVQNATAVTNEDGVANAGFDIPVNTEAVEFWARYEGSVSEWPAETEVLAVEVRPAPTLVEILLNAIRTPQVQLGIIGILAFVIVALAYVKVIKPRREAGRLTLERQLSLFHELASLQHFMAIYTEHGTCVIYYPFAEKYIEPDLISGFISAITSVYGEITGEGSVKGTLEEIHYHGLRLNSYSGRFIIGMLILKSEMSSVLKRRLEFFVDMFESQYESDLEDWKGRVECFDPEWVLSNLISTLDYYWLLPQRIGDETRIAEDEKEEAQIILEFLKDNLDEKGEFLIEEVLKPLAERLGETEAEVLERLLTLQEEGVIEAISVQTLMTRRNLGLSGVEGKVIEPVIEEESEPVTEEEIEAEIDESEAEIEQLLEEEPIEAEGDIEEETTELEETTEIEVVRVQPEEEAEETTESEDEMYAFLKEVERQLREKKKKDESEDS